MSTLRNKTGFMSCLVVLALLGPGVFPAGASNGQDLLADGLVMEETFSPGRGRSVGRIQVVQGDAVIMHADILKGYRAERGLRLYDGDTLVTLENAKIRFRLNDGSILSLSSETKLTLNKSVYQNKTKQRSSFLGMALGKARFFVVKLMDYKRSEFKVKTPTAVCGVRGSDFILEVSALETVATALENTEIEIRSLEFPDEKPITLKDFEMSRSLKGKPLTKPMKLSPEEIKLKKESFAGVEPDADDTQPGDKEDAADEEVDDTGVDDVDELGENLDLEDFEGIGNMPRDLGNGGFLIPETDPGDKNAEALKTPGELPDFPQKP
jgi:hypothetical protein